MAERVRRCQDDYRAARSSDPSLLHRRNRKRQLAIQKPNLTTASRSLATALLGGALARGLLHPAHASPPLKAMADGGQNCTPIRGRFWKPIDNRRPKTGTQPCEHFAARHRFNPAMAHGQRYGQVMPND